MVDFKQSNGDHELKGCLHYQPILSAFLGPIFFSQFKWAEFVHAAFQLISNRKTFPCVFFLLVSLLFPRNSVCKKLAGYFFLESIQQYQLICASLVLLFSLTEACLQKNAG